MKESARRIHFWRKVDMSGGRDSCWAWTGLRNRDGYGLVGFRWRFTFSHRVALRIVQLRGGDIPKGLQVLHRCDNPPCCNPAHLWLGTHQDNMDDMVNKGHARGRGLPGEGNGSSKLTNEQVRAIRAALVAGETQLAMASRFGVAISLISRIHTRKAWRHLA